MDRLVGWMGLGLVVGCGMPLASGPQCRNGLQEVEGQCVPVSTIVFRECVAAFRTASVQRDRGDAIVVGGSAKQYASARVERDRRDVEHTEYAGVAEQDSAAIIEECRRQEQAERDSQLYEAWAAADEAEQDAELARDEARRTTQAMDDLRAELERAQERSTSLEHDLTARSDELGALRTLAQRDHPCEVEAWDACAEAATIDHAAGDFAGAHRRYESACEAGVDSACGNWGLLFEHGLGVPTDIERATSLYAKACDADELDACARLGVALHRRDLDRSRVTRSLTRACEGDVARGCTELARVLEERAPAIAEHDAKHDARIDALFERACHLDDALGCFALGQRFASGARGEGRTDQAPALFDKACALGDQLGCIAGGRLRDEGLNPVDPKAP